MAAKKSKAEAAKRIWDISKPASELTSDRKLKVLLSGPSGSGKSTMCARTGRVLYVPTEMQAIPVVQDANPDALVFHNLDGRAGVRSWGDINQLRALLRDPSLEERVDWVVIDGLSDMQTIVRAHFTKRQTKRTLTTDQDTWGIIVDMTARLAREFRDLPVNVIVTTLDMEVEAGGRGVHRPAVSGKKLPNKLLGYFNLAGFTHVDELDSGEKRWQVMFRSDNRYLTKGAKGINDIEPPEPLYWLAKRFGGEAPADVLQRVREWERMEETNDDNENDNENEKPF